MCRVPVLVMRALHDSNPLPGSRRRPGPRPPSSPGTQEVTRGLLLLGCGFGALIGLLALNLRVKLDTVLALSKAIYNLISGLQEIADGLGLLLLGLGQMLGFIGLAALAVTALVAMASGSIRIGLRLMPQLGALWSLLATGLNGLIRLMSLPQQSRSGGGELASLRRRQELRTEAAGRAA